MLTGAEKILAQAIVGSDGISANDKAATRLKRRYVPQFVGKRFQDDVNREEMTKEFTDENELITPITDAEQADNELTDLLKQYVDFYSDNQLNEDNTESRESFEFMDRPVEQNQESDESNDSLPQEDKRYIPSFVGKRYQPTFVGKRYQPTFVGKRMNDDSDGDSESSVDKRYQPMFVGKRYQPSFVGKRYQPMFVGKRYQPMFVGKRYQPTFVGKRYQPMFVGKRYQPMFVGKRYQPMFVGKRYIPSFVGKRYQPMFVGKRYQPFFIGKKSPSIPMFVGKKDGLGSDLDSRAEIETPYVLEKRSASSVTDAVDKMSTESESANELKRRSKRSLLDIDEGGLKRSWGRYEPMQNFPSYDLQYKHPLSKRRFVPPEFIGRRDSIASILSALKVLRYTRSEPKFASKRFQAPLFIGKRAPIASSDLFWDSYDLSPLNDNRYDQDIPSFGVIQ